MKAYLIHIHTSGRLAGLPSVLALLLVLALGSASGQIAEPTQDDPSIRQPAPAAGEEKTDQPQRPILLREGSHLLRVVGRMRYDEVRSAWVFAIDPEDEISPGYELTMMPCTLLAEMERMIESAPGHQLVFELTGDVYVHRNRNYLVPTHPPLLIGHEIPTSSPDEQPEDDEAVAGDADSTSSIIDDLEQSVGPLARRPDAAELATSSGGADAASTDRPVREGTVLLSRRGIIRRTGSGAFLFVFDADAEGLADAPMTLLPCLLLQRLERRARLVGGAAVVLLSGRVYTYHGRNYLLPTVYRIPREKTQLTP